MIRDSCTVSAGAFGHREGCQVFWLIEYRWRTAES